MALSGALPGLVGATFRRRSAYAYLRQAVTLSSQKSSVRKKEGQVILKLFNLLVPELMPSLLAQGVWVLGKDLGRFFKEQDERFWNGLQNSEVNDRQTEISVLRKANWTQNNTQVLLVVKASSNCFILFPL